MAIDFSKYADKDFKQAYEIYPEGTYKVQIERFEKCIARTGMEQMRVYATIVECGTESNDAYAGKPIADHIAMSTKAEWRLVWFLSYALGWGKEELKSVGKIAIGSERMNRMFELAKGRTMYWVVTKDPQYGNNKILEYIKDEEIEPVLVDELDGDIPDFIRNKE